MVEVYADRFAQGLAFDLSPLSSKILQVFSSGISFQQRCQMGILEWAVDCDGTIYPCDRLVGH